LSYRDVRGGPDRRSRGLTLRVTPPTPPTQAASPAREACEHNARTLTPPGQDPPATARCAVRRALKLGARMRPEKTPATVGASLHPARELHFQPHPDRRRRGQPQSTERRGEPPRSAPGSRTPCHSARGIGPDALIGDQVIADQLATHGTVRPETSRCPAQAADRSGLRREQRPATDTAREIHLKIATRPAHPRLRKVLATDR
jgi:hypothetical protein